MSWRFTTEFRVRNKINSWQILMSVYIYQVVIFITLIRIYYSMQLIQKNIFSISNAVLILSLNSLVNLSNFA